MWKAVDLLGCQRPRTNFTQARDRRLAGATPEKRSENPDSFVFGHSTALADEASQLVVRVLSAELPPFDSVFGLGLDLFILVHLEEDGQEQLLGRSSTIWMCTRRPCWDFTCPKTSVDSKAILHFKVMCESFAGWGESWCFGSTSASIRSLHEASRKLQLSLKSGSEFKGLLNVEVDLSGLEAGDSERPTEVVSSSKSLKTSRSDSNTNSLSSQGSTLPEQVGGLPDACSTASESEEEDTNKVATAMLRHWRQSESFTQAKNFQELAGRLQLSAKKYEVGKFYKAAKARFFVIIGQEAFLGGLNLQETNRLLASSLELAWFESKTAFTERQAPLGSIPLHQVRSCSMGVSASRYANLDETSRSQMVVVSSLGPSGPKQLEVICESKQTAKTWSQDLRDMVSMVKP